MKCTGDLETTSMPVEKKTSSITNHHPSPSHTEEELRCLCGSLMARFREEGLELKCKRCKRLQVIRFSQLGGLQHLLAHLKT
jgi:hypothetical protein